MDREQEWREHILEEIRSLRESNERQNDLILELTREVARLEVKASIFGVVGGMVPVVLGVVVLILKQAFLGDT
jgi:hypothetical protein